MSASADPGRGSGRTGRFTQLAPVPAEGQLERVVELLRELLRTDLLGAYLYGSALAGGLKPRSDLDVLVVAARPTTTAEKRRLAASLLPVSGRDFDRRPVEVTIVAETDVKPWRYPPRFDFQFGEWLREDIENDRAELGPTTNPDVALLLTMARHASRPLVGPPVAELIEPVPSADLSRALLDGVDEVMPGLEDDTRNSVLTLARIWLTVETGEVGGKDRAADWALERLPPRHREVLARARAVYLGEEDERWDDLRPRVQPYGDHVAGEIRRLLAARAAS